MRRALALGALWMALVAAGPPPPAPPPPDLAALVPLAAAPLDKPPVLADVPLPPAPVEMPLLPLASLVLPAADKPVAFVQPPRALPCIGAWTGVASESLECGRARFQQGEYDDAARALESAARPGSEAGVLREARYWLGETYYRLGRVEQADWLFRQVTQDGPRQDWGVWSLHSSGWTALRLGDAARARDAFAALLAGPVPAPLDAWGRHGLGLASYALGRHEEAEQAWALMASRGAPAGLAREIRFWHGEALGRVGQPARAEDELKAFLAGGPPALVTTAQLRLGWWALAAGHAADAVAAFRAYLAAPGGAASAAERDWGDAGLTLALLAAGDWAAARDTALALDGRRSPLALPLLLRVLRAALDSPTADVEPVVQQALGANLAPPVRGWVLLVKGEVDRAQGNRDEARTQFDLVRRVAPGTTVAWEAIYRLARSNFELREFTQALSDLASLGTAALPRDLQLAVLVLQGEAAYHATDYAAAAAAFQRARLEFPDAPETPAVRLALAWTALRQGRADAARREFVDFARGAPDHPHAADALLIAAELAAGSGDLDGARELLERVVTAYPGHPRGEIARLNRAILLVRAGDAAGAQPVLREWLARAPFPGLLGRAHGALGAALVATGDLAGARRELALAKQAGLGPFASLGFGVVALAERRWDDAVLALTEARDSGPPDIAVAAEYGLGVAAFGKGDARAFKQPALAALDALPPGARGAARAGALLDTLTGIAVEEKDWRGALDFARRLVTEHPEHAAADDALERVAATAALAQAWPVVVEADTLLRQHYPQSPFVAGARVRLAEALLETGKVAEARQEAEQALAAAPTDGRALMAVARAREKSGDRAGALEAYSRAARESPGPEWTTPALFGHARLLVQERRWDQARAVLDRLLRNDDPAVAAEAAHGIGDAYAGEGDALAAAEFYLTAAYVAPASPGGRRALLGAARAFATLRQDEAAATAYRRLLAQTDLPPDLAAAARQGLSALGR